MKFGIADEAKAFIETSAKKDHVSEADIVRRALEAYRFLEQVKDQDGQVILKRADGQLERLVRF